VSGPGQRLVITGSGDAMVTHRIRRNPDPSFAALAQMLRDASVSLTNLEMVFPGLTRYPSTTMHGTPMAADQALIGELEWLGIDLYSLGNNHATDYGIEGLQDTLAEMDRRGLVYAGAGRTLRQALEPKYIDVPGGRVALVAAGSSNARLALAADPGIGDAGRPGIAPIRVYKTHFVAEESFGALRDIISQTGVDVAARSTTAPGIHFPYPDKGIYDPPPVGGFAVEAVHFAPSDRPRVQTDALEVDILALERSVHEAARQADLVLVALHCHEGADGRWNIEAPAEFLRPLAHRLIDAGAHALLGHGPHMLRGMEMYRGRPICYSLGNFVFNLEATASFPIEVYTQQGMPADSTVADLYDRVTGYADEPRFWESVVPRLTFNNGVLESAELHPITLGGGLPRGQRGCPVLASAHDGERILERVARLSEPFDTAVTVARDGDRVVGHLPVS
jgi:poly-gamma-glutamate synthesis protein (capsule biosynthesis protein)